MADKELEQTRKAVTGTMNDLFDTVQTEVYEETIKELREHITLLENELDKYRELLQDEIKNAQKMLIKRCMYAVAIFFVVLIVNLVFGLLGTAGDDLGDQGMTWTQCWDQAK